MDIYGNCRLSKDVDANDTNMSHQKYSNITVSFAFGKSFALIKVYPLRITTWFGSLWLNIVFGRRLIVNGCFVMTIDFIVILFLVRVFCFQRICITFVENVVFFECENNSFLFVGKAGR